MSLDMNKVEAFAGQVVTDIGHKLGLYRAMAGAGAMTSTQLAEAGFRTVRRATETPFNIILEARL